IYADVLIAQLQLLSDRIENLTKPQPLPWEYRGVVTAHVISDSNKLASLVFPTIPTGEVWEIEQIAIATYSATNTATGCVYDTAISPMGLRAVFNAADDVLTTAGLQIASDDYSPPVRMGGGSIPLLAVTVQSAASEIIATLQYRMLRMPKGGRV